MSSAVSSPEVVDWTEPPPESPVVEAPAPAVAEPDRHDPAVPTADVRREAVAVVGQGLTVFGLLVAGFLVYLVGISALEQGRQQRSLRATFARDLDFGNAWIGGAIPEGAPVAEIRIPELGVREIVVEGTTGGQLRKGPGHLRASPLPGQRGNVVIAGKRTSYGGPFSDLDQLEPGDRVEATTGQGVAVYRVTGVEEISADAPDVIDPFGDNRLTLLTSAPRLTASRRLVVTASLQTPPRAPVALRPTDVRREELGLHSDRSTVYSLLLWAQLLLVASLGAAWLRRRWARWPAYLVAVPVLALLAVLVFDSFAPVLPSTL